MKNRLWPLAGILLGLGLISASLNPAWARYLNAYFIAFIEVVIPDADVEDGRVLTIDTSTGQPRFVLEESAAGSTPTDLDIAGATANDLLYFNGTNWDDTAVSGHVSFNGTTFTVSDFDLGSDARGMIPAFGAGGTYEGLAIGSVHQFLGTDGTDPIWRTLSGHASLNGGAITVSNFDLASQVQGSVAFYNGTDWVHLGPGTSGYVLTTLGPGANPEWQEDNAGSGATTLDTKGQIQGYNGSANANIAPGTNGYILAADETDAEGAAFMALEGHVTGGVTTTVVGNFDIPGQTANDLTFYNGTDWDDIAVSGDISFNGTVFTITDISLITTRGDVLRGDASGNAERLALGSAGLALRSDGTDVAYGTIGSAGITDNDLTASDLGPASVAASELGILTTKGDLMSFTTDEARKAVGSNGQILAADESQSDGLLWTGLNGHVTGGVTTTIVGDFTLGSDATGGIPVFDGDSYEPLAIGTDNQILDSDGTNPVWRTVSGHATQANGVFTITDFDLGSDAQGMIPAFGAGGTYEGLAIGTAHQFLGTDGTDPIWRTLSGHGSLSSGTLTINNFDIGGQTTNDIAVYDGTDWDDMPLSAITSPVTATVLGQSTGTTISSAINLIDQANGDQFVYQSAFPGWSRIAAGTTGHVWTMQSSGLPGWEAPGSGSGAVLQVVSSSTSTESDITTTIPVDDTIPQNTEGTEILTRSITPTSSSSTIRITFIFCFSMSTSADLTAAIFEDANADAKATTGIGRPANAISASTVTLVFLIPAGSTSSRTYKARVGPTANTVYVNQRNSSGDTAWSTSGPVTHLIIEEVDES